MTKTCPGNEDLCRWLAASDGEADPGLTAHVESCFTCQADLERLTALGDTDTFTALDSAPPQGDLARLRCLLHDTQADGTQPAADIEGPSLPGYEVLGELGRGGMGIVYKARQVRLNRLVAIKMIRHDQVATPEELIRFGVEGETVARLQHPNIVQIHEVGTWKRRPYFALEFVAGGSLEDRIDGRPQSPREAAALIETLARAIDYAHREGIVHRDLKPANVLLAADGTPKIADFGLARLLNVDLRLTRTGAVAGTPAYMAPEQAKPRPGGIGPAADVYALGAILYECLTGRPPFVAPSALEVLTQVQECDPVPPSQMVPQVPRDLQTVCLKCLRKEPEQRYASARALANDLRRFLDGKPVRARPLGWMSRGARWCRRNPLLAAALGVIVATVAVAFVWIDHEKNAARALADQEQATRETAQQTADDNERLAKQEQAARKKVEEALANETKAVQAREAALRERDAAARRARAVNDYLVFDMIASTDPYHARGSALTMGEVLDRAAAGVAQRFAAEPDLEEAVREALGQAYVSVGQPRKALEQLTIRAALCRRLFGADDPHTLAARAQRLSAEVSCFNYSAVVEESAALRPLLRRAFGPEHPVYLQLVEETARSQHGLGKLAEAQALQEEVVAGRRRTLGAENERTLGSYGDLASILADRDRGQDALRLCEEQLPVARRLFGAEHRTTLSLLNGRCMALMVLRRFEEAEKVCAELLPVMKRRAGPEHFDTLMVTNNLACVLLMRGRTAEACQRFEECLPGLRRLLGENNLQVTRTACCYAGTLSMAGRLADAEKVLNEVVPQPRRVRLAEEPIVGHTLAKYGVELQKVGKHAEAEPIWRAVLEGRRKSLPAGHWEIGEAEIMLGCTLVGQQRFADAEPLMLAGYERTAAAKGRPAPADRTPMAAHLVAVLYENWGKPEQAAAWRARAKP